MSTRRQFLSTSLAGTAAISVGSSARAASPEVIGAEHWTTKTADGQSVRLFLWRKQLRRSGAATRGTVLFVHGSSEAGGPTYDLQVPGKPEYSVMDWFARLGFDTWMVDCEGYGRSDKQRPIVADVATGADDVSAAVQYILKLTGRSQLSLYGASSGSLRAALYTQRQPQAVQRLVLDAFVWTGEGSVTLAERRTHLDQYRASNRRPVTADTVQRIFTRDHPGSSDQALIDAFTQAVLALDTSVPNGTYIDMCANLPLVDPARIPVPTAIMRGQYDGIATFDDVSRFFGLLPNPDKSMTILPGVAHASLQSRNWQLVYHVLEGILTEPAPVYTGA